MVEGGAEIAHPLQDEPWGVRRFFVIDLSTLGTTVNGKPVAKGYDDADGAKRENGVETPLGDAARIGLAGMVYLDFQTARP